MNDHENIGSVPTADDPELDDIELTLRAIADHVDPVPSIVDELARAALETRNLDAQLAALTADSILAAGTRGEVSDSADAGDLVGAGPVLRAGHSASRMVVFETEDVTVELEIDTADAGVTVRGLLIGTGGAVELETPSSRTRVPVDAQGWFSLGGLPSGALRLRVVGTDGRRVTTEWIAA